MLKLRAWWREWRTPTPARHPGLDEPFTPATTDEQRIALLTRWRQIAMWAVAVPQGYERPDWWDAADHFAVAAIFATDDYADREWMIAGVTASGGEVRAVPVAGALAYLGQVLGAGDTTAVAAAMTELRRDFAWAKAGDAAAAALARLKVVSQ